jgi:Sulfotransferase domain
MPVFALWSAPRARSTAFFRSMLERGDLLALHEPIEGVIYFGRTEVDGRTFESHASLLTWLREETPDVGVFVKETTDARVCEAVLADRRFLVEARHAFLIRRPEEIATSLHAVTTTFESPYRDLRIEDIGLEALHVLHTAVRDAGGQRPVVIDSEDLVARPAATMAAYCAAVGLPYIPHALSWESGDRPEWRRSARWHADVSASSGFEPRPRRVTRPDEISDQLARFAAHHRTFYEQRLDVTRRG